MDDINAILLEELKSLNRKNERLMDKIDKLNDKIDTRENVIRSKILQVEDHIRFELQPIKKHVTQVKFVSALIAFLLPASITLHQLFI